QHDTQWLGAYTNRFSLLGEVHSNVVLHKGVVYAQTGEGMLHAFDEKTGEELWAYLPKAILKATNASKRDPEHFIDDDIRPLMTGKIALVKVGDEMVLLGNTGGLERYSELDKVTDSERIPVFYAITVEDASGAVSTTKPLVKWSNYGRCNDNKNTSVPNCGFEPIVNDWKTAYLSNNGVEEAVAFLPTAQPNVGHTPTSGTKHALMVFSVATGESKILYTDKDVGTLGKMTDVDFIYKSTPLASDPGSYPIKEVYAGDTNGYIWRVSLENTSFKDILQPQAPVNGSTPAFTASFADPTLPISVLRVSPTEVNRGGVATAPQGRMIVFGTGNPGTRQLDVPLPNTKGVNVMGAYFDATKPGTAPVSYSNLIPQTRKADPAKGLVSDNVDIVYSDTVLGWTMNLLDPTDLTTNDQEQVFASPFLFGESALFYTAIPKTSTFDMINVNGGYFMQLNVKTGKIEDPAPGSVYEPILTEGVFVQPSLILNETTKNTHFNIKYASQEPYTESKVYATQAFNVGNPNCTPSPTTVCGMNHTLNRLSLTELAASVD
ncbi:MAG: hypothetical protein K2P98_06100, partial [Neisseriaceae bacterium]|nr:hypothetical protein [Neisseriaceae bacterium]